MGVARLSLGHANREADIAHAADILMAAHGATLDP